jgi:hypothetical protein
MLMSRVDARLDQGGDRVAARQATDETLADLLAIAERRQDVAGGRALARRAAELGHDVSHTTLNKILSGKADNRQSVGTLDAIAALAGVSRSRAHTAAGRRAPGKPFADELPAEADLLNRKQRDVVLGVVRALLDSGAATGDSAPPLTAVARRRKS